MNQDDSGQSTGSQRHLIELLADEFAKRLRKGESPSIEDYAQRHPDHAEQIRQLFPALKLMDEVAPQTGTEIESGDSSIPRELTVVGDYRIVRKIGQGGMGVVYEAKQESLDRRVALKVLPHHVSQDDRFVERFKREAASLFIQQA